MCVYYHTAGLGVCKVRQKSMKIVLDVFHVIEKIVNELKHEKGHIWATFSYIFRNVKKIDMAQLFSKYRRFFGKFFYDIFCSHVWAFHDEIYGQKSFKFLILYPKVLNSGLLVHEICALCNYMFFLHVMICKVYTITYQDI